AEAVANDVHARGSRVLADLLDEPGEPGNDALVVEAGPGGEGCEDPDAPALEEAPQDEESRPAAAEATKEEDGGGGGRRRAEADAHEEAERHRGSDRAERPKLARTRPPPRRQGTPSSAWSIVNPTRPVRSTSQTSRPPSSLAAGGVQDERGRVLRHGQFPRFG